MRIRSIKPEFWQSETIAKVSHFARLLAIAILNYSDDDGHFWFSIPVIRGALFPFDEPSPNIRGGFAELSHIGFLEIGDLEGKHVCRIPHFLRHQKIDKPQKPRLSVKNPVFPSESWKFDEPSPNIREFPSTGTEEQGNRGTGERGRIILSTRRTETGKSCRPDNRDDLPSLPVEVGQDRSDQVDREGDQDR